MKKKSFLIISICLALNFLCWAQEPSNGLRFKHLTIEDGLSQNMVDCLLQDQHGFVWIGTWNGLCRYDGYDFEIFNDQQGDKQKLGNNFIYEIHEDHNQNIWVGTQEGLYRYNYPQRNFETIKADNGLNLRSSYRAIISLPSKQLLIGSTEGLTQLQIEPDNKVNILKFIPLGNDKSTLLGNSIQALLYTPEAIWVGTDEGLYKLNQNLQLIDTYQMTFGVLNTLSSNNILSLYQTKDKAIWVGTESGLCQYQFQTNTFNQYLNNPNNPNSIPHNTVMDLMETPDGKLAIATLGGLSIKSGDSFQNYTSNPKNNYGLNNDFLNTLMLDKHGNLWIGNERGGINILNARQNNFDGIQTEIGNTNTISHNTINSIFEEDNYLWIGTAGGGLNRYDKHEKHYTHFRNQPNNPSSISSDFITTIHKISSGELWLGTWGQGLNILTSEKPKQFIRVNPENSGLSSHFISSILEDNQGRVWIGSLGGLNCYNPTTQTFSTITPKDSSLTIRGVGYLMLDKHGLLWVATREGLFRLNPNNPTTSILALYHNPDKANTLSNNYIISLLEDQKGNIWAGTYGQGLNKITIQGHDRVTIKSYNRNTGISNNIIYSIQEDQLNQLWLGTDYGLSRFDPQTELCRNFYVSDGLLNNQYYWSASYKNTEGTLYFGGMAGIDIINPNQISEDLSPPQVTLTELKLLEKSVTPHEQYNGIKILNKALSQTNEVSLSYKEKVINLSFSTFNYLEADRITYQYILEGFDQIWNTVPNSQHTITYTSLSPGDYVFKIKAAGPNGVFSQTPTTLTIHIIPPIWETLWFKALAVTLIILSIGAYTRYRLYILKRQKVALEAQVSERTEEIQQQRDALSYQAVELQKKNEELAKKQNLIAGQNHKLEQSNQEIKKRRDELIDLNKKLNLVSQLRLSFFTNISHEFRTPLTLIIGPLERLLNKKHLDAEVKNNLKIINRNANRLLHLIDEIMDFRKIERKKIDLKISEDYLDKFCEKIVEAFKPLADIKEIDFQYEAGYFPKPTWFDQHKAEHILYNLLSNAFKYTPNGGFITVVVEQISKEKSRLNLSNDFSTECLINRIKVIDSGSGINKEDLPLIFKRFYRAESESTLKVGGSGIGLAITEELIKAHYGDIFVTSEIGEGSVFEVQFPCLTGLVGAQKITIPTENSSLQSRIEILKSEILLKNEPIEDTTLKAIDKGKNTIVLAEDNPDLRIFLIQRLKENYNVIAAIDGEQALQLAEKHNPDLIISDVMMPKKNGFELCKNIKNDISTSHIPVILLTAKSSIENQIEGLQLGADDYLPKPFHFELLKVRIHNLINSRKKLREQFSKQDNPNNQLLTKHNDKDQRFLQEAISIVEKHLDKTNFGANDLVKNLGLSRSVVHKKLTSLTNYSTSGFINHLRIRKAKELLKTGELNISQIAYTVGYNDPKYFSRVFSKQIGQSPKQFQEIHNSV